MWEWLLKIAVVAWLVVVVWHLRPRPGFPQDLVYRVGHWEAEAPGPPQRVEPLPPFATLAGLRPRQPIEVLGENQPIAEIIPVALRNPPALYALKPGKGIRITSDGTSLPADVAGWVFPALGNRYRLQRDDSDKSYSFILDYR